jgi:hypothetical protein
VGAASLALGLLFARRGRALRRTIIGFEILLVPLQLATSVRSNVPLLGVVPSIAVLVMLPEGSISVATDRSMLPGGVMGKLARGV